MDPMTHDIQQALEKLEHLANTARQEMETRQRRQKARQQQAKSSVLSNATEYHETGDGKISVQAPNRPAIIPDSGPANDKNNKTTSDAENNDLKTMHSMDMHNMKGQLQGMLQEIMTLRRNRENLEQRIVV